ncbi:VWA domain-containing protein [Candidatus Gracilibacteria bacterium]|nr:VWA domain-containing protein [Candidatus Gracilibacteria bacterium]
MDLTNFTSLSITIFLIILLGGAVLLYRFFIKREKLRKCYTLLFSQSKHYYIKYIFLLFSSATIALGVFGIKYASETNTQEVNGIDISFVLDVSKSMNALDFSDGEYSVSRLDFTKALLSNYILENPENRYGLVIFAGDAISTSPLTTDHSTFLTFLQNVNYQNLNIQGTNLEKAVDLGVERLYSQNEDDDRAKVMIVLSDGGDQGEEVNFDYITSLFNGKQVSSYVIGIGKTSGAKIPISQDYFGNISYQQYKGQDVITKLNSDILSKLSSSIDGEYLQANSIEDLESISSSINSLEKKAIEVAGGENKKDFSRILAIISLILFAIYVLYNSIFNISPPLKKKK